MGGVWCVVWYVKMLRVDEERRWEIHEKWEVGIQVDGKNREGAQNLSSTMFFPPSPPSLSICLYVGEKLRVRKRKEKKRKEKKRSCCVCGKGDRYWRAGGGGWKSGYAGHEWATFCRV